MSASKAPAACRAESRFLLFLLCVLGPCALAQDFSALDAAAGQALFERNWVQAPASSGSADGLGPYYNARSCAACHPAGGGNSKEEAMNVVLDDPVYGAILQRHATAGLLAEAPRHPPISRRRAPALHGMAALEQVSLAQLQRLADPDDSNGDGISGRLTLLETASGPQPGRYGWQAQVPTLRAQIARALSLDLGLGTSLHPHPAGDCTPAQTACLLAAGPEGGEPEVSDLMLDLLEAYLRSLPPPVPVSAPDAEGAQLFTAIGCAACHVPALAAGGQVLRPYTDLLLHDMGLLPGDDLSNQATSSTEWRTAPLWGLGQAHAYLHDARTTSLEQAILWHRGEASAASAAYGQLNEPQRRLLLEWLQGL